MFENLKSVFPLWVSPRTYIVSLHLFLDHVIRDYRVTKDLITRAGLARLDGLARFAEMTLDDFQPGII